MFYYGFGRTGTPYADIEAMYNQVKIPEADRDALRFLWYEGDNVMHYRMTSHLFGGVWCASSSSYALQQTLRDYGNPDPLVSDTVTKSFYVDDLLRSVSTDEKAKVVIVETPKVLATGGFRLTKFVVNDASLLQEIPQNDRAKEVKIIVPERSGKVLGVRWSILSDDFFFDVRDEQFGKVTRRRMLSFVASMYDPLGFIGPVCVVGKLIFQEATRRKLDWDDVIPDDLSAQWVAWVQSLAKVRSLRIPRCMKPGGLSVFSVELHHFADASSAAYGCCSYLRCVDNTGEVHTKLVMSKNKVAPLKQCTIPRLELQAAVMAVKVDALLRNELDVCVGMSVFWTDAEIVLKYIRNEKSRFHVFVGNRVAFIRQHTDPIQWRHISGKENPVDTLSRGCRPEQLDMKTWLYGPKMLDSYKVISVDVCVPAVLSEDDPEVKRSAVGCAGQTQPQHPLEVIIRHYASWYRMKRAVAWWKRLVSLLGSKGPDRGYLTVGEIKQAEVVLLKHVQSVGLNNELERLAKCQEIPKSSPLSRLRPFLDDENLMRVGGRLGRADLNYCHPYIVPKGSLVSRAIVREVHGRAHLGTEWVHSIIRKEFWIIGVRSMIKSLIRACVMCGGYMESPVFK